MWLVCQQYQCFMISYLIATNRYFVTFQVLHVHHFSKELWRVEHLWKVTYKLVQPSNCMAKNVLIVKFFLIYDYFLYSIIDLLRKFG